MRDAQCAGDYNSQSGVEIETCIERAWLRIRLCASRNSATAAVMGAARDRRGTG